MEKQKSNLRKSKIKTIRPIGKHGVWDIQVEDDHSYVGNGIVNHNSSSRINLQNIPSTGSRYAKVIKECFSPEKGWLFVGADFSSLEDRINALLTKDKNKLKVYTDGYCSHCLRAYYYFRDQMPDIVDTVESINSIADKYPDLRQKSKTPTFLLTYGGTWRGIVTQCGLSEEEAKSIEANYHKLYKDSDIWLQKALKQASKDGYATGAFGLRIRTPILKQTLLGRVHSPTAAQAEARTLGNAISGQSFGLLNNRAAIELQERLLASEFATSIIPIAHIHDAQYFLAKDNVDVIHWLNENLVDCMEWQELPELAHESVKIRTSMSIFYPNWSKEIAVPNHVSKNDIINLCKKGLNNV